MGQSKFTLGALGVKTFSPGLYIETVDQADSMCRILAQVGDRDIYQPDDMTDLDYFVLFAAAPELYEAAYEALRVIDGMTTTGAAVREVLLAAIAKAEGRAGIGTAS